MSPPSSSGSTNTFPSLPLRSSLAPSKPMNATSCRNGSETSHDKYNKIKMKRNGRRRLPETAPATICTPTDSRETTGEHEVRGQSSTPRGLEPPGRTTSSPSSPVDPVIQKPELAETPSRNAKSTSPYSEMASRFIAQERYEEAIQCFKSALEEYRENSLSLSTKVTSSLDSPLWQSKSPEQQYRERSILEEEDGRVVVEVCNAAATCFNLGALSKKVQQYTDAERYFRQGEDLYRQCMRMVKHRQEQEQEPEPEPGMSYRHRLHQQQQLLQKRQELISSSPNFISVCLAQLIAETLQTRGQLHWKYQGNVKAAIDCHEAVVTLLEEGVNGDDDDGDDDNGDGDGDEDRIKNDRSNTVHQVTNICFVPIQQYERFELLARSLEELGRFYTILGGTHDGINAYQEALLYWRRLDVLDTDADIYGHDLEHSALDKEQKMNPQDDATASNGKDSNVHASEEKRLKQRRERLESQGAVLWTLSQLFLELNQLDCAVEALHEAMDIKMLPGEDPTNPLDWDDGNGDAANDTTTLSANSSAIDKKRKAQLGSKSIDPMAVRAMKAMGFAKERMGDWDAALRCFERVLMIESHQLGPTHVHVANSLYNVGRILERQGNPDGAMDLYHAAYEMFQKLRISPIPYDLVQRMARLFIGHYGSPHEAIEYLTVSLEQQERMERGQQNRVEGEPSVTENDDLPSANDSTFRRNNGYYGMSRQDEAIVPSFKNNDSGCTSIVSEDAGASTKTDSSMKSDMAHIYHELGRAYMELNEYEEASRWLVRSAELFEGTSNEEEVFSLLQRVEFLQRTDTTLSASQSEKEIVGGNWAAQHTRNQEQHLRNGKNSSNALLRLPTGATIVESTTPTVVTNDEEGDDNDEESADENEANSHSNFPRSMNIHSVRSSPHLIPHSEVSDESSANSVGGCLASTRGSDSDLLGSLSLPSKKSLQESNGIDDSSSPSSLGDGAMGTSGISSASDKNDTQSIHDGLTDDATNASTRMLELLHESENEKLFLSSSSSVSSTDSKKNERAILAQTLLMPSSSSSSEDSECVETILSYQKQACSKNAPDKASVLPEQKISPTPLEPSRKENQTPSGQLLSTSYQTINKAGGIACRRDLMPPCQLVVEEDNNKQDRTGGNNSSTIGGRSIISETEFSSNNAPGIVAGHAGEGIAMASSASVKESGNIESPAVQSEHGKTAAAPLAPRNNGEKSLSASPRRVRGSRGLVFSFDSDNRVSDVRVQTHSRNGDKNDGKSEIACSKKMLDPHDVGHAQIVFETARPLGTEGDDDLRPDNKKEAPLPLTNSEKAPKIKNQGESSSCDTKAPPRLPSPTAERNQQLAVKKPPLQQERRQSSNGTNGTTVARAPSPMRLSPALSLTGSSPSPAASETSRTGLLGKENTKGLLGKENAREKTAPYHPSPSKNVLRLPSLSPRHQRREKREYADLSSLSKASPRNRIVKAFASPFWRSRKNKSPRPSSLGALDEEMEVKVETVAPTPVVGVAQTIKPVLPKPEELNLNLPITTQENLVTQDDDDDAATNKDAPIPYISMRTKSWGDDSVVSQVSQVTFMVEDATAKHQVSQQEGQWWWGVTAEGLEGWFPTAYVHQAVEVAEGFLSAKDIHDQVKSRPLDFASDDESDDEGIEKYADENESFALAQSQKNVDGEGEANTPSPTLEQPESSRSEKGEAVLKRNTHGESGVRKSLTPRRVSIGSSGENRGGPPSSNAGIASAKRSDSSKSRRQSLEAEIKEHEDILKKQIKEFGPEHSSVAATLFTLAVLHTKNKDVEKSGECVVQSLTIHESLGNLSDAARSLHFLGDMYSRENQYNSAISCYSQAQRFQEQTFGYYHEEVANTLNRVGNVLARQGEFDKAMENHKKALGILKECFGEEVKNPLVSQTLIQIGAVYYKERNSLSTIRSNVDGYSTFIEGGMLEVIGRAHEDRGSYRMAIAFFEEKLQFLNGDTTDELELAETLNSLGMLSSRAGLYMEALDYYDKALEIQKKLGCDEIQLGMARVLTGSVQFHLGHYRTALRLFADALDILRNEVGPEHETVAATLFQKGLAKASLCEYDDAMTALHEALGIQERLLGESHPATLRTRREIGNMYAIYESELPSAFALFESVIESQKIIHGEKHPNIAETLHSIGCAQARKGELSSALKILEDCYNMRLEFLGMDHPLQATTLHEIAKIQLNRGQHKKALHICEAALTIRTECLSENHLDVAMLMATKASCLVARGDFAQARKTFLMALPIVEQSVGASHPSMAAVYVQMGNMHLRQCHFDEATATIEKALDIYRKCNLDEDHPGIREALLDMEKVERAEMLCV